MVKLRGPGLAADAAGQLAGELVFSHWKGKAYLKKRTPPKQPRAPGQVATRAMMSFLSSQWSVISASDRATWYALAAQTDISPVNAYHAYNLQRWRSGKWPSAAHPATETGDYPELEAWSAAGGVRCASITIPISNPRDAWGLHLHRALGTSLTPAWNNCVHVLPAIGYTANQHTDTPLPAGVYTYRYTYPTIFGRDGPASSSRQVTVTD